MSYLKKLLDAAAADGMTFRCTYDGEVDYEGDDPAQALKALEACDEMFLSLLGRHQITLGVAQIIHGLDGAEVLADYSGKWFERYSEANPE